ncbi:hypothetical protein Mapa_008110 [Marchantia paleacea]|nr:hypothetical protein Mapa_008110 [Marchantia paleacea]
MVESQDCGSSVAHARRKVVVKQSRNPYYMYIGIVQRVTDGRACVIFEGGNWDKLVTFKIADL